jgi:hypothetical protein
VGIGAGGRPLRRAVQSPPLPSVSLSTSRRAGDGILFGEYAGQESTLDGEEYFIMKEDDVLAVIEGPTKKKLAAIKGKTKQTKKG